MTDNRFDTAWKQICEKRRAELTESTTLHEKQIEEVVREAEKRIEIQRQQRREEKLVWLGAFAAMAATVVFALFSNPTFEISKADPVSLSDVWYWEVSPQ